MCYMYNASFKINKNENGNICKLKDLETILESKKIKKHSYVRGDYFSYRGFSTHKESTLEALINCIDFEADMALALVKRLIEICGDI